MNAEFGRVIFYGPSVEIDSAFGLANGRADFLLAEERVFQAGNYRASIEITNGGAAEGFTGSYRLTVQQIPEPPFHCLLFSFTAGIFLRRVKPSLRSVRTKCCS
jgi:hypothetical protein